MMTHDISMSLGKTNYSEKITQNSKIGNYTNLICLLHPEYLTEEAHFYVSLNLPP